MFAKKALAYVVVIGSVSLIAVLVALVFLYGSMIAQAVIFLLYASCGMVGLLAIRYGVMPILKSSIEVMALGADTLIRISDHRASMEEKRKQQFMLVSADERGNYALPVAYSGQLVQYIQPGNTSSHPRLPRPRYEIEDVTPEQIEAVVQETLQIEGPQVDPATVRADDLTTDIRNGLISPGVPPVYGYKIVTDGFTHHASLEIISNLHAATAFLVGYSGSGKSAFVSTALARRIVATNGEVALIIIDPHKGNADKSITAKIRPALDPWIVTPKNGVTITGKNPKELRAVVDFLNTEKQLRLGRDDLSIEQKRDMSPVGLLPIWVIVDEALSYARDARLAGSDPVYTEFMGLMQSLATETAKAGITAFFMTQLGTKKQLGDMEIKDACPEQIILRTPEDQGQTLGLTSSEAKQAARFPQGRGFITLADGGEPEVFVWGYGSPEAIAQAVEGIATPLIPEWKQETKKAVLTLVSRGETGRNTGGNFHSEKTTKLVRNTSEMEYPAALQAALEKIPQYAEKLAKLEVLPPYSEKKDIWIALFGHTPGGDRYAGEKAIFDVLAEAARYKYQMLKEAR